MTSSIIESIAREICRVEEAPMEFDDLEAADKAVQIDEVTRVLAAAERLGMRLVDIEKITRAVIDASSLRPPFVLTLTDAVKIIVDHTPHLAPDESA